MVTLSLSLDSIDAVVLDGAQEFALESIADVAPYTVFRSASIQRSYRYACPCLVQSLLQLSITFIQQVVHFSGAPSVTRRE